MNILFVNYGDFTTNSLNHIGGFANWLIARGHACTVAVPDSRETLAVVHEPRFRAATYAEVLAAGARVFPDGRPADLLHAWTPRDTVRKFILAHQRLASATRVIVHLEDNEEHLAATFAGQTVQDLRNLADDEIQARLPDALSHPRRYRNLLHLADGVTVIVDRLREFVPSASAHLLPPGVDFSLYQPREPDAAHRQELGLPPGAKVIVYTGSTTFANRIELRELLRAVHLLDRPDRPVRLVRTGFHPAEFSTDLDFDWQRFTLDQGFVAKDRLPRLLALADVLVQPGRPGSFDDYRLPSKLPEYLAMGRPVVLPACNLGTRLRDGQDALLLQDGSAEEIVRLCERVFTDGKLARQLGANAAAFARRHFDLTQIGPALLGYYQAVLAAPAHADWSILAAHAPASESSLLPALTRNAIAGLVPSNHPGHEKLMALFDDLAQAMLQTENLVGRGLAEALRRQLEEKVAVLSTRDKLTLDHATNLTRLAADLRRQLEEKIQENTARERLTTDHIANLTQQVRQLQDSADELSHQVGHLKEINADLETRLTARERAFTETLAQLRAAEQNLAEVRAATHQRIAELEMQVAALQRQGYNFQAELVRVTAELDHEQRRLGDLLANREQKIRQMQASFSWQATAPLRALRRAFFDDKAPAATPAAVPLPSPEATDAPKPRCHVDEPAFWHLPAGPQVVRGWSLLPGGFAPARVRVLVGDREFPGQAGLTRPDVGAVHGANQGARCGFRADVMLEAGQHTVRIEGADEDGRWHLLLENTATVFPPAIPPEIGTYDRWLQLYDTNTPAALAELRAAVGTLARPPLISVVMPVYNAPEKWLRRAIESVRNQVYGNWELCIANDASPALHIRPLLDSYAATDPRIKVVHRTKNGHISLSSNSALELVTGEYVALLDHDDELPPRALARMALEIARHPDAVFFYSDEDKIDERGRRYDAYFKPDFLPDLLLGQNCLSHLSVIRTDAIRTVGGFRAGLEGSQDWDLALRIVENLPADRVRHVPEVLYHWRAIAGSTALAVGEKNYTVRAAERALRDHLARRQLAATLEPVPGDHWRVRYALPDPAPLVSLIIPTRDRLALVRTCVESLLEKTDYPAFEILILDNESTESPTLAWFAEIQARDPRVKVLHYPHPFNYSALNNFGVRHAAGTIVGLLNNDLEVITPGWLAEMVAHAVRPEIGAVGAMLYYPDDRIQHAGVVLGLGGVANHAFYRYPRGTHGYFNRARLVQNFSAVTGACLLIRKAVFEEVGGLNEQQLAIAFNDIDFCLKVRAAGYRNLWTPFAEFYHHESASRGAEDTPEKLARFAREVDYMRRTWGPMLDNDPAYNPNFSLEIEGFKLANPPRLAPVAAPSPAP